MLQSVGGVSILHQTLEWKNNGISNFQYEHTIIKVSFTLENVYRAETYSEFKLEIKRRSHSKPRKFISDLVQLNAGALVGIHHFV